MGWRVALVGAGRLGQQYIQTYATFDDCEMVALVEPNASRLAEVGAQCGVGPEGQFGETEEMLESINPDIVCVVTPVRYMHAVVMACARHPSVKAVQCDKPVGAVLREADEMVEACEEAGVIFAGGNLQRALGQLQEAAGRLRQGVYGSIRGAMVHSLGNNEISGAACSTSAACGCCSTARWPRSSQSAKGRSRTRRHSRRASLCPPRTTTKGDSSGSSP